MLFSNFFLYKRKTPVPAHWQGREFNRGTTLIIDKCLSAYTLLTRRDPAAINRTPE